MPQFSIIIPCFNAEHSIAHTLASLSAQTLRDWEAICVDDGSTDQTAQVIARAAHDDPRIRLVQNTGKGPSAARNLGVRYHAHAKLIAFCDADDQWQPSKLADLAQMFFDPSLDGAFGRVGFFRQTIGDTATFSTVPQEPLTIDMLLGENPVCTLSNFTLRKAAFLSANGFDERIVHNEDLEFLIRLLGRGASIEGSSTLHTWYRTSEGGLSSDLDAMLRGRAQAIAAAARFGVSPSQSSNAVHHRYLARRALRLASGRTKALRHTLIGLKHSPRGFLSPARRGVPTLIAALLATFMPPKLRQSLFS